MPGCSIQRETDGDRTVIRVAGVFDRASALELRDSLEREPAHELVLDFSLVREFADLGVATLAHGLAGGAEHRLHLRGLRQHQLRMFRYFGLDVDTLHGAPAAH
jgi:anti-anti-sigma regulatory factor